MPGQVQGLILPLQGLVLPFLGALAACFFLLVLLPIFQRRIVQNILARYHLVQSKKAELEVQIRSNVASLAGSGGLVLGLLSAMLGLVFSSQTVELTRQTVELTRQGQVNDRYQRWVNVLAASANVPARMAAIDGITAIARDESEFKTPSMVLLEAFIRVSSPRFADHGPCRQLERSGDDPYRPTINLGTIGHDVQGALKAVGELTKTAGFKEHTVDLSNSDLCFAYLPESNFEAGYFRGSDLRGAILDEARLTSAEFNTAVLEGAHLHGVAVDKASFIGAKLSYSRFDPFRGGGKATDKSNMIGTNFTDAVLENAILNDADLSGATFLRASLNGAQLDKARLGGADFKVADLAGSSIGGADLTGVVNLTQAQLNTTCGDAETKLPADLSPPKTWPCAWYNRKQTIALEDGN
jgi:uncharacterized protein YjbI with pentapeptide repeats